MDCFNIASIKTIFYLNYSNLSIEVILNILPSLARNAGEVFLKTILTPLCTLIIYIILILFIGYVTEERVVIFVGMLVIPILLSIGRITGAYKITLQQETEFRRFNIINKADIANYAYFMKAADFAVKSDKGDLVLLGLNLLHQITVDELPVSIYKQLNNNDYIVRKAVINYIKKYSDKATLTQF